MKFTARRRLEPSLAALRLAACTKRTWRLKYISRVAASSLVGYCLPWSFVKSAKAEEGPVGNSAAMEADGFSYDAPLKGPQPMLGLSKVLFANA